MDNVSELSTQALCERLQSLEQSYREGHPLVSDEVFDEVYVAELKRREPDHPYFQRVGAEPDFGADKVRHPSPMLSTAKAYSVEQVTNFVDSVNSAAQAIGLEDDEQVFRVTAKLDGMAARYDGKLLVSRGDGLKGNDITAAIAKGIVMGEPGVGEIVLTQAYFDSYLAEEFEHPRNVVVGAVAAKEPNVAVTQVLDDGAIRFVNYEQMSCAIVQGSVLVDDLENIVREILDGCEYPTDGVIIEAVDDAVKTALGATSHHHRWMLAKKDRGESAITSVVDIEWTAGRTGRITPTVLIEPVRLSGATLSRVTAHHAGNVKALGIGKGASLRIIRSGEVIPFIERVQESAEKVDVPTECPSCEAAVVWEGDFIVCKNDTCEAQLVRRLHHFFDILGNLDLFGRKSVQKIVEAGYRDLVAIYRMSASDFEGCGFGAKQAENLVAELQRSRTDAVEDWRFLGAFGIHYLGRGSARRLLKAHAIESLAELSADDIEKIGTFGPVVAPSVHGSVQREWPIIRGLLDIGFKLVPSATPATGALAGKRVVFTGAMDRPRKAMEAKAASLGAEVQKAVSGKTDWLITGDRVGATKLAKAEKLGVEIVPVAEYATRIRNLS